MRRALISGAARLAAMAGLPAAALDECPGHDTIHRGRAASVPAFLQPGRCYRFTFPITGAPNWKVLEVLDAGWIRAEVDAGPANSRRESAWVNTAQIIIVRAAPCSE